MTLKKYLKEREKAATEVRVWDGTKWSDIICPISLELISHFNKLWAEQYYQGQINEFSQAKELGCSHKRIFALEAKRAKLEQELRDAAYNWFNSTTE